MTTTHPRPIVFFDIESTGIDVARDRIVTLAAVKVPQLGIVVPSSLEEMAIVANPGFLMPPEVIAIHGITNERVQSFPPFKDSAPRVLDFFNGCDVAGYNLLHFDVPMLWEEFFRAGITWDLSGVRVFDAANIFKKKEPRTLSAAVKFYTGGEHAGAHDALSDVHATIKVLVAQRHRYADIGEMNPEDLAAFSQVTDQGLRNADLAGKLAIRPDGVVVFNFGKAKGVPVKNDPGFARWMVQQSWITNQTKQVLQNIWRTATAAQA